MSILWADPIPNTHLGMFADLTPVQVLDIDWPPGGGMRVTFAEELDAATAEAVQRRMQSTNAVEETLRQRARDAIEANQTFIDLPAPTNAQAVAQIKFLSRCVNNLIRLALRRLDSAD
jgi:hypothetical protein